MYREAAILGLLASGRSCVTNYGRETAFRKMPTMHPQRCAYKLTSRLSGGAELLLWSVWDPGRHSVSTGWMGYLSTRRKFSISYMLLD